MKIGVLHPGEMGVSIAASAINGGHAVFWTSQGRSDKTRTRADRQGLIETRTLAELCQKCDILLSVCPPHAALDQAQSVIGHGFTGYYLDANAISPRKSIDIGTLTGANGARYIDGGIIGGPAWEPHGTTLYLSGRHAAVVAELFEAGPLDTKILDDEIGRASALKMCYAAYSKGTTALLCAVLAAAESSGVRDALNRQWDMDEEGFSEFAARRAARVFAKAWRFEGEMHEIEETFQDAGVPHGFHEAAADVYHRLAHFKDAVENPGLANVLNSINREHKNAP